MGRAAGGAAGAGLIDRDFIRGIWRALYAAGRLRVDWLVRIAVQVRLQTGADWGPRQLAVVLTALGLDADAEPLLTALAADPQHRPFVDEVRAQLRSRRA